MFPAAIPRVEATRSHRLFVEKARPDAVMVNLVHARQIVKRGETAASYFPEGVTVIATSTISDTQLHLMTWERERDIIAEFQPDYHIPTDQPVYEDHDSETRRENIADMARGAYWMNDRVDATVVPLIKGLTTEEREIAYRALEALGTRTAAFYAAQYFNSGGNYIAELESDVEKVLNERDVDLLLIGLLSPEYVGRMPDGVRWVAGQTQWRERVAPTQQDSVEVATEWEALRTTIEDAVAKTGPDS